MWLADAGLTVNEDKPALAGCRSGEGGLQLIQLFASAHKVHERQSKQLPRSQEREISKRFSAPHLRRMSSGPHGDECLPAIWGTRTPNMGRCLRCGVAVIATRWVSRIHMNAGRNRMSYMQESIVNSIHQERHRKSRYRTPQRPVTSPEETPSLHVLDASLPTQDPPAAGVDGSPCDALTAAAFCSFGEPFRPRLG